MSEKQIGLDGQWGPEEKSHDLGADNLPFVSFRVLSIRDNLECTPPASETDGSEEADWKEGIINI